MVKPKFIVFTQKTCPWCLRAKQQLAIRDYDFTEKQIGKDITAQEFKKCFPDTKVPLILAQDEQDGPRRVIGSYNELIELLDSMENGNSATTAKREDTHGDKEDDSHKS